MTKPVPDKAEFALEYPDKFYIGTFERTSRFDAHFDKAGVSLSLDRTGGADVRKSVHMHFHFALFAEIHDDLARTASSVPIDDVTHRETVRDGARNLYLALDVAARKMICPSNQRRGEMRRAAAFPAMALAFSLATSQSGTAQTSSEPRFLMACVPCHGFDGIGNDSSTPNLAGQGREYLYNQLMAFRAGQRKHPAMNFFSIQMTREELGEIVKYYSELPRR